MNTINNLLSSISNKYCTKTAFKFLSEGGVKEKSYLQLESDTNCLASMLKRLYGTDKKMAILSPTSYEWFLTYFSVTKSSNVIVTLDYTLDAEKICQMMDFADVEVLFISEKFKPFMEIYKEKCPKLKDIYVLETDIDDFLLVNFGLVDENKDDTVGQIIFTSGTTGKNKAVMLTHKNLTCLYHYGIDTFNSSLVTMSILPVHHVAELINGVFHALISGATVCINDKMENLAANMQIFKPNCMTVVPLIMNKFAMIAAKTIKESGVPVEMLSKMTLLERRRMFKAFNEKVFGGKFIDLIVGGSAMDADKAKYLELVGISVTQGYGLTETTAVVAGNEFYFSSIDNCGVIYIKGISYKLVEGELLIKGPNVMKGYYKDEEETKNAFDDEGYFKTGDLATVDEKGNVRIVGRKKDLIILDNGENVSPEELQMMVAKEMAAMVNIVFADKNSLCCGVFLEKHDENVENLIRNHISKINEKMPSYKKIANVYFTTRPFVLTAKNSVKRRETIANILEEVHKNRQIVLPKTEMEIKIFNKVKEIIGEKEISITDSVFELGMDSLQVFELATEFNLNVQDIYEAATIEKIAKISNEKTGPVKDKNVNELIEINRNIKVDNSNDNYFITGATGFLGAYIVNELASQGKNIYLLVRNKDKMKKVYAQYFRKQLPGNVKMYIGDIRYQGFGLSNIDYNELKEKVENVVHIAALVKHVGDKKEFMDVNVTGTKHAISFAKDCNAVFNYASSYSVSGFGLTNYKNSGVVFNEDVLNIEQNYEQNIYVYTKYLAEKEVLNAKRDGLKANIYRIGSLTWDKFGTFQVNEDENGLINRLRGLRKTFKYMDGELDTPMDLTPVDECAKAFVTLMQNGHANNIYHLFNPNAVTIKAISEMYNEKYEGVNKEAFKEIAKTTEDKLVKTYANYELIVYPMNGNMIDCKKTLIMLALKGFNWSVIDKKYLDMKI